MFVSYLKTLIITIIINQIKLLEFYGRKFDAHKTGVAWSHSRGGGLVRIFFYIYFLFNKHYNCQNCITNSYFHCLMVAVYQLLWFYSIRTMSNAISVIMCLIFIWCKNVLLKQQQRCDNLITRHQHCWVVYCL